MIGRLRGELVIKQPPRLMIDVGGIGYEAEAPMSTFYDLPQVGQNVVLFTHLHVREDAHTLYAFASEDERSLFRDLIRVSGVLEGFEQQAERLMDARFRTEVQDLLHLVSRLTGCSGSGARADASAGAHRTLRAAEALGCPAAAVRKASLQHRPNANGAGGLIKVNLATKAASFFEEQLKN